MMLSREFAQAGLPFMVVPVAAVRQLLGVFTDHSLIIEPSLDHAVERITEPHCARRQPRSA